ncbi:hypothetical protein [Paenibacillus nasutitermitis]|uniref:Uncharacterized protein n=1 Tax=Paenibacillus nasutitermitis TaxID=1652958 RepID=A0A916Z6L1_9BACL|nr:hypothetical protein [Paenibacillus nasutitermitis]GGD78432.1 hypothetical protein GCM10010911_40590 [Paenibacillus nasutitermitis]
MEQSKGGTKQGNKGFLFGTCHSYVPVSSASESNRMMKLFSLPTLAWDPTIELRCTLEEGQTIIDESARVNGVAHLLFHPAALHREGVAAALVELAEYGRNKGLQWWTSEEIYRWMELKRGIEATVIFDKHQRRQLLVRAQQPCKGVTVLLSQAAPQVGIPSNEGAVRSIKPTDRFGLASHELVLDLNEGETVIPID